MVCHDSDKFHDHRHCDSRMEAGKHIVLVIITTVNCIKEKLLHQKHEL